MVSPMASAACYDAKRPFHRSASFNIPRSKTPGPGFEKKGFPYATGSGLGTAELPKRARTPVPHEEDARHRRRTGGTNEDQACPQRQGHAHTHAHPRTRTKSYTHPIAEEGESKSKYADPSFRTQWEEYQRSCDELASNDVDFQVRIWMIQEETRRIAAVREAERTRLVQDEIRRIQAKLFMQREAERIRILEEMCLGRADEECERARRAKMVAERTVANAWIVYERNWTVISSSSSPDPLSFSSIPWPTLSRPSGPSSITLEAISAFLLSDAHSTSQTPRERIKEALRRWHPDRFVRFLRRVPPEEQSMVEEAVGIVARCLNELLSRYPV
ncbi:hypothetical protein ACEPAG_7964 [Sanghuangporus baumii]